MIPERLNEFQAIHKQWKEAVTPPEFFTPREEFTRSQEEYHEVAEALETYEERPTHENARELAMEAVDVMVGMLGLVSSLGLDAETLLAEKLETMQQKYNPVRNQELRAQGMDWKTAMREQKVIYQRQKSATSLYASS